nr:putative pentatricopeptide repeat-containing protein At3g16710, mitochondrial [Quercus suber]
MQACGQLPDPQTYAALLDGLCKNGQVVEAIKVFLEMEDKTLGNDIVIYNILIDGLCHVGNLKVSRELFYSLLAKGLQPNVRTYTIMLKGLCKEGLLEEASEIFEKMDGSGCSPMITPDARVASMFFDLLSSNQVDKNIQEFLQKPK